MADYKIKFEYKGGAQGKKPLMAKVPSAKKAAGAIAGAASAGVGQRFSGGASAIASSGERSLKQSISITKRLTTSLQKLIGSNKTLKSSLDRNTSAQKRSSISGGASKVVGGAMGGSFGRIGSSIPILGAAVAGIGFAISQISKVGNAFIQLAGQQSRSVGVGGFQSGRGMYLSGEMGAGMKSFGMATGRFENKRTLAKRTLGNRGESRDIGTALDIGAIYGLSAEETMQTAGQFRRATGGAGAYQQAAAIAAGMGVESELQMMLSGMAGIMTEAVREGVNTSDLSTDMAKDLGAIVQATPQKSVEAAMNIVKSFQGVQKQVAGGKMASMEGLYTTRAAQSMLMERLTKDKGYVKELQRQGVISKEQAEDLSKLPSKVAVEPTVFEKAKSKITGKPAKQKFRDASFSDLMQAAPSAGFYLTRKMTAEASPVALQMQAMKDVKSQWGAGAEGLQRFTDVALSQGWSLNQSQIQAMWSGQGISDRAKAGKAAKKGAGILDKQAAVVSGSASGMAIGQQQRREGLTLQYGADFAEATIEIERAMANFAKTAAPTAVSGVNAIGSAVSVLSREVTKLTDAVGKSGMAGVGDYFKSMIFGSGLDFKKKVGEAAEGFKNKLMFWK